jgi:hypothetical protein
MKCEICGREADAITTYGKVRNVAVCPVCDNKLFNALSIDPVWMIYQKAYSIIVAVINRYGSGATDINRCDIESASDTINNLSIQLYNRIGELVKQLREEC